MRKSYLAMTLLLAASSLTGMAAKTEADFNSAKDAAIAKMTSWSSASPFAPEAFEQGLADMAALKFGDFASGDKAVEGVDALMATTLEAAREEFNVKLPTIFVTMTTDALTANPVDGKSLFGTMDTVELLDVDAMVFKTFDKACQASAWHLYPRPDKAGIHGMRNNMTYYLRMYEGEDGKTMFSPYYAYPYQPDFKIDFADNGKMQIRLEDGRYMGTDANGGMTVYDDFCDAASWTFTRAYGTQCDMPMLSTKSDPKYYMFRNVYDPDSYLISVNPESVFMEVGKPGDKAMWLFQKQTVCPNDWVRVINKDGSVIYRPDDANHLNHGPLPGNGKAYLTFIVIDGYEDQGLFLFLDYQCRFQIPEMFKSPSNHLICYDPSITPGVQVDLSYFKEGRDIKRFLWTIEDGADAGLSAFLEARESNINLLKSYRNSQPWAHDAIDALITEIGDCVYTNYDSTDAAIADMESKTSAFLATLPDLMLEEGQDPDSFFTLNNVRREQSNSEAGWMVTTVDGAFANTKEADTDGSIWQIELISGNSFRLKNREGYYVGSMKSGQNVAITRDAESAAKLTFKLIDGNIQLNGGRSCLNLDDNDGTLMANPAADPGSQWRLVGKVVIDDEWLQYSTFGKAVSYEITSLARPELYLEGSPSTWYVRTRDYFNDECYWYFEKHEDGNGCYIICTPYGGTRSRIWWWKGDGNPCMFDDTANERASYDDRWYLIPVDHEDNSDEQRAYQISSNYPPAGNSCISVESNMVGCLNMKPATEKELTTWIFKKLGELDHERIFNDQLALKVPVIEGALAAQPWARSVLDPAYERLTTCTMEDFGGDSYAAIPALTDYVDNVLEEVDWLLEEEPDGCAVRIKNVRRAEAGNPEYLAAVDGHLNSLENTVDNFDAITWNFEYYNNGRYRLRNDKGEYMGALGGPDIAVTENRDEAGLYALVLNGNTMELVVRNEPDKGLNLDNAGGNAGTYNSGDAGSQWVIELVRRTGVEMNAASGSEGGLYDLRGFKVNPENATPGIYIERRGGKVIKRVIR